VLNLPFQGRLLPLIQVISLSAHEAAKLWGTSR
jgi:hypothetical protein